MELTEEQINEVRHWASVTLLPAQIANILQLPQAEFVQQAQTPGTAIHQYIQEGLDIGEAKIKEATFKAAAQGSSPAIAQANKYLLEYRAKNPKRHVGTQNR
jgi:hypothetical protein